MQPSPILFWALFFLLGCACVLYPHWVYLFPIFALLFLTKRKGQGIVFLLAGILTTLIRCPSIPAEEMQGRGVFQLEKIQPLASFFQHSYALKGKFLIFESSGKRFHNIPCLIIQKKIPKRHTRWILEGNFCNGIFKLKKNSFWQDVPAPFSLAHLRFQNKEKIRKVFHHKIADKRTRHFFASMATGDIDDSLLGMEFRKVGLAHILAISGFHFALIAAALGMFLSLFLPQKWAHTILLGCLGLYYLFLGFSPSILRAFLMIFFFVLGRLLHRRIDVCNLLGAALLLELILDPWIATQVGFQLSFLATLSILLFYQPMHRLFEKLLPLRSFSGVQKMTRLDQHGYLFASAIRKGLALNASVHLCTLPVLLFAFHSFPLLSLAYNLILPPFLGISLLLLPLGILLPPLGTLNAKFTSFLLQIIANPPELLHFQIFCHNLPYSLLILLVSILCLLGLTKSRLAGHNDNPLLYSK